MSTYFEDRTEQLDRFEVSIGHTDVRGGRHPFSFLHLRSGVCVLGLVGDQALLVREMRFAVGGWQDELPAGGIEDGETPEQAARRELVEETGHRARVITSLGSFYPSFGSTDEKIHLFCAECEPEGHALDLDPGEDLSVRLVPYRELVAMTADGRLAHGAGIAAVARYELTRRQG